MTIKTVMIMTLLSNSLCSREAIVIKTVIDLIPQKMGSIYSDSNYYNQIPLSPVAKADLKSCPRVHQLLFNEIVNVVKVDNDEVVIEAPNIYYQTIDSPKKNNTFWTLESNLIYLDKLKYNDKLPRKESSKVATLIFPFEDNITNQTYSAGTKFVYKEIEDNTQEFIIYILDPKTLTFKESQAPKKFFITKDYINEHTKQKQIANFVNILKKWATLKHGFIPYVWGGSSFCNTSNQKTFDCIEKTHEKNKINYFEFADYNQTPKTGFDCSGLIVAATQIAGLAFPFKNTTTIMRNLKSITKDEAITEGNIIWIPGHVIIITDLQDNLCVEARGYLNNGAGKVHEIELNKLFKNINSFNDLKNAFFNKKKLERLDMQGKVFETHNNFKILKLDSC